MRCPNCNSRIDNNLTICNYCGSEVHYQNDHEDQYEYSKSYSNVEKEYNESMQEHIKYSEEYSNTDQGMVSSDDDYVNAYLGKDYQLIRDGKFNVWALLFGPFYLAYRKVDNIWFWTLLGIIAWFTTFAAFFMNIYLGYAASSILLKDARKKVDNIKNDNSNLSSTELIDLCSVKGKGNKLYACFIILFIVLIVILAGSNQ